MSVYAVSWVLRHSEEKLGRRLVLLVLADYAGDEWTAWPSVATIAHDARLSDRQVQNCLRGLEAEGAIERVGKRSSGVNVYRLAGGENTAPGEIRDAAGVKNRTDGGEPEFARTSNEPPEDRTPRTPSVVSPASNRPGTVGKTPVSDDEYELALKVLALFNRAAETRYIAKTFIEMIVRRCREHPELSFAQHALIIATAFEHPWWKDAPAPNVIYGNESIFERSLNAARSGRGGTPAPVELATYGTRWGPGTEFPSLAAAVWAEAATWDERDA
jgi:hypothetical protein